MATRRWATLTAIFAGLVALTLVAGLIWPSPQESDAADEPSASTTSTTVEEGTTTTTVCQNTWPVVQLDNGGHRVVSEGVAEIRNATTPEEAKAAAVAYLELVKTDPEVLAGVAKYFLKRDVDPSTLHDGSGCATSAADQLVIEISLAIGESLVVPDQAPADATNSGVGADGTMTSAGEPGISGDRTAIKIVMKDGTTIWILARCGNPVVQGPGPHPVGPTDNPPPPPSGPPTTACPPPRGVPPEKWDYVLCRKKDQTFDQMQNESQARQDPQDNTTSGVDVGSEPGVDREDPPPPAERPQGDPDGGSGDGGAGPATGPMDNTHEDDETTVSTPVPCPFGEGNC